jgi:hypothetical protein
LSGDLPGGDGDGEVTEIEVMTETVKAMKMLNVTVTVTGVGESLRLLDRVCSYCGEVEVVFRLEFQLSCVASKRGRKRVVIAISRLSLGWTAPTIKQRS